MKILKLVSIAFILTCFIGVVQTEAQAHKERGTEIKPLIYEVDGVEYLANAYMEYQFVWSPSGNMSWIAHGKLTEAYDIAGGSKVLLNYIPLPKKAVNAYDPRGFDEKVKITPNGKVTVVAHLKDVIPWW